MKTEKSVVELLENIDTSYLAKSDEQLAIAYAERADYLTDLILSAVKALSAVFSSFKVSRMSINQPA